MPLGWERINAKKTSPNKNIVFIKPRPGPDEAVSKDYLERIAAQCVPIMNKNHLSVASLEEYEPNLEFWGRNFNNGEVIQLVLKSPSTGHWLPFKFVQMVMMHELAHCKQMNHSKAFWAVRNEYTADMKTLWDRGYTGEGLWGRGVLLENGAFARETLDENELLPEHMCGGTFKSKGSNKRKAKPKITYKERQERRIKKKFGTNGMALGADDDVKAKLENGKRPAGKPRVAGSARGRELRAAAALARFETKENETSIKDEELVTDSESDTDNDVVIKPEPDDAIDINGTRLLDKNGHGMVKICGEEDREDVNIKNELEELQGISKFKQETRSQPDKDESAKGKSKSLTQIKMPAQPSSKPVTERLTPTWPKQQQDKKYIGLPNIQERVDSSRTQTTVNRNSQPVNEKSKNEIAIVETSAGQDSCLVCSFANESMALTCAVCANVLKPELVPNTWQCQSAPCKNSLYRNSGDAAFCGVCAARKSDGI